MCVFMDLIYSTDSQPCGVVFLFQTLIVFHLELNVPVNVKRIELHKDRQGNNGKFELSFLLSSPAATVITKTKY